MKLAKGILLDFLNEVFYCFHKDLKFHLPKGDELPSGVLSYESICHW